MPEELFRPINEDGGEVFLQENGEQEYFGLVDSVNVLEVFLMADSLSSGEARSFMRTTTARTPSLCKMLAFRTAPSSSRTRKDGRS
jgi:hypothetical protein